MKYSFFNDYSEGAHSNILLALKNTNSIQDAGYGEDVYSNRAAKRIKKAIGDINAEVHFVSGGTQANLIVIDSLLKPYESIIAPVTSHINNHEAGAIEATGHKINTIETQNGKISPAQIIEIVESHTDEHMVVPRAVFISQATELGTIYSKKEMEEISNVCKKYNLYLYIDGARIGSAITAKTSDLNLSDIASLADVFYIGGTKNGALLGEAIVITNKRLQLNFRYYLKRHGALLAKGRVIGIQFDALFEDNLLLNLAKHANEVAEYLSKEIKKLRFPFLAESYTNQIFPIFPNVLIKKMSKLYGFYEWKKIDDKNTAVRLVTSWATPLDKAEEFIKDLKGAS